jgi:hypothetical protein
MINWLTYKYSRDSRPSNESLRNSVRRFSLRILEDERLSLDQNSSKRERVSSDERYGEMGTVIFCSLVCKLAPLFGGQLKFPVYNSLHLNHPIPRSLLYSNTCPCSQRSMYRVVHCSYECNRRTWRALKKIRDYEMNYDVSILRNIVQEFKFNRETSMYREGKRHDIVKRKTQEAGC